MMKPPPQTSKAGLALSLLASREFVAQGARVLLRGPGEFRFGGSNSGIIEMRVLAVRRFARGAAAEVARGDRLAVPFVSQEFDEPGFVLDLFVQNSRSHIVSPRIFAKCNVGDFNPAA